MSEAMFHLPVPVLEKILRPVIIYICLIGFLRLFGKRELAQLNPFDLVVLLSLSNTVQNAMIGEDNSVTGGLIGAFSMLCANWLVNLGLFKAPRLKRIVEGKETNLIVSGKLDREAMNRERLTDDELMQALSDQNIRSIDNVQECSLDAGGTFSVELKRENDPQEMQMKILKQIETLTREVRALKAGMVKA